MRRSFRAGIRLALLAVLSLSAIALAGAQPVKIPIDPHQQGSPIPNDFAGLSFETAQILPGKTGRHYFDADRTWLITLFKTLGIKHVRVGGNSVDSPKSAIPTIDDVRAFFEFAKAVGVKVIFSVRLQDGDPQYAAKIAAFIHNNFRGTLDCFAIGNEPGYYKDPAIYRSKWMAIRDAIAAVVPGARFCGPDDNPNAVRYANVVNDFSRSGLVMLTMHNYPGGCAYKNPSLKTPIDQLIPNDPAAARERLLSTAIESDYEKARLVASNATAGAALPFRLDETNSYWYGGLQGASDSHAAALWSLDYLYWWAANGARGLNFHTGERVGGGEHPVICRYATFLASGEGYDAKPLAYGLKMFALGAKGKLIPVDVPATAPELSVYATSEDDYSVTITLINRAHSPGAAELPVQLSLSAPSKIASTDVIYLTAPASNIAAIDGLTIGGAPIQSDGTWQGHWTPVKTITGSDVTLNLQSASAAIVRIRLSHPD